MGAAGSPVIGLLHPGEMGAAIGAALRSVGHSVVWASEGRSASSAGRAAAAGLEDVGTVPALRERSGVILSVVPPAEALGVAELVRGHTGIYVDANAVSPATTRAVGEVIEAGGGRFVDGGIIGGPPRQAGDVRVYLSGPDAAAVAELFVPTVIDAPVLGDRVGDASAIKMAYAGWTKGTIALLLSMREYARRAGVEAALLREWSQSQPQLEERHASAVRSADAKGWRWIGEMNEIAAALRAAGLPGGFHDAAAAVYADELSAPESGAGASSASAGTG